MKMTMKYSIIFEWITLVVIFLAFFSLVFDLSWKHIPIGFVLGYALSVVIERIIKILWLK